MVLGIGQENLQVEGMSWSFQGKATELPLTSEPGFCTLREQVKALREPSACIVIVHHPKPFTRKPRYAGSDPEEDEENPELKHPETENTRWGKKVSTEH